MILREGSEGVTKRRRMIDEHWRPKLLDEVPILGDFRDARDACPSSSLLVVERHINIGVVLDLVELVSCVVCDEEQAELRWRDCCSAVRGVANH